MFFVNVKGMTVKQIHNNIMIALVSVLAGVGVFYSCTGLFYP